MWDCEDVEEVATLLTSELVTNAVVHTASAVALRMQFDPPTLLTEVHDTAPSLPEPLAVTPWSSHGRGLSLIEALSRRWGTRKTRLGKVVWFELEVAPTRAAGVDHGGLRSGPRPELAKPRNELS